MADETTPLTQAYQAYERLEGQLSVALERLVATNGFADLLATSATNVMALTRLANGTIDRVVRTTRLAARHDVTELARQLVRTEAKLEKLLQIVEELQGQLNAANAQNAPSAEHGVSSATAPSLATPITARAERPANAALHNGTALSSGAGRVRASRAAATKAVTTKAVTTKAVTTKRSTAAPKKTSEAEAP